MKKLFLFFLVFALSALSLTAFSQNPFPSIDLDCNYSSGGYGTSTGRPRTPVNPPLVYQDDHIILFDAVDFCDIVQIVSPNTKEVLYEAVVSEFATEVMLPLCLQGEYEIRFCRDTYYYSGVIVLN